MPRDFCLSVTAGSSRRIESKTCLHPPAGGPSGGSAAISTGNVGGPGKRPPALALNPRFQPAIHMSLTTSQGLRRPPEVR
jgi:hypothetical protein